MIQNVPHYDLISLYALRSLICICLRRYHVLVLALIYIVALETTSAAAPTSTEKFKGIFTLNFLLSLQRMK